ncbi:MAG: hypothetical protein GY861_10885 [bacterium]|nr:hypothetical protein [bacterium]
MIKNYNSENLRYTLDKHTCALVDKTLDRLRKERVNVVEKALEEYFAKVWSVNVEDLLKVKDNTNNFKLRGFEKISSLKKDKYYHNGLLILSVVHEGLETRVYKHF